MALGDRQFQRFKQLLEEVYQGNYRNIHEYITFIQRGGDVRVDEAITLRQDAAKVLIRIYENKQELSKEEKGILGNAYAFLASSLYNNNDYRDFHQIIELCEKAIALDNTHAMCIRARLHRVRENEATWETMGNGKASESHEEAMRLYDQAIKLGSTEAMCERALLHRRGWGLQRTNYQAAIELLEEGIRLENAEAMYWRAYMHRAGEGGPVNYPAARKLFDKAAQLGHADAKIALARMHKDGEGEPRNYVKAVVLFEEAIKCRHSCIDIDLNLQTCKESLKESRQDVDALLDLIWDQLLDNEHFSKYTIELLREYPDLIVKRLLNLEDLDCLNKVVAEGHIIKTILTVTQGYLAQFFRLATPLQQVESHIQAVIKSRQFRLIFDYPETETERAEGSCVLQ